MKKIYIDDIKNAIKSKEYWFGFSVIIISCVLTSIYNINELSYTIGSGEFFMIATMYSNMLLRISAPVISVFVCMNQNSLFFKSKEELCKDWNQKEIKMHMLAIITIGCSIFLLTFLLLLLSGIILFPSSTGSIQPQLGLFKQVYNTSPMGYCIFYIINSCICGALYALFGASLKIFLVQPVNMALFVPLIFYSCFKRIGMLFPFKNLISFISPLYTFDISLFNISLLKRIVELSVVLGISIIIIIISYKKYLKETKAQDSIKL